ncbi:ABC transporter ATP-binding protein [Comamonas aquatica]|uniref:ABC transporter ATP-binding protein n=1 Tax=Comamonas aquatica TaxID=225991 RepID=UPI0024488BEE|nr:ABC transporter ATP-binding protein [Comamonas aquatica]MDH0202716.1 ABC transporter ATP-binding protein [Comamonas aquatica]MDH0373687.1 ABC transporter ATP-binding protein [Comamonas aquatica]MDH1447815.1 ABC transporter ATP-binding protein [Comamonas aquatica]
MSDTTTPLLEVRGIEAGYGASQVLFGVSLTIEPHQVVSLMGRNGMGKSTTIKCITGALPVRKGQILFEGRDITNLPADVIARLGIAIVPEGRQCFPNLTVREHLEAFARPPAQPQKGELAAQAAPWDLARIYELFPRLKEREHHMGNQLSGGEQQMLAIGRALSTNPKLLILDEATEGLAPVIREEIWKCLSQLKTKGQAILVVDKYIGKITSISNLNLICKKGIVSAFDDFDEN